jgi:hypothetical protein
MPSVLLPQSRIAIGHAMYGGQRVPVMVDLEWSRYFYNLTTALNGGLAGFTGAQGQAGAAVALSSDEGGEVEFIPGPPGPKGDRGEPGPALWMLEDPQETEVFWKV